VRTLTVSDCRRVDCRLRLDVILCVIALIFISVEFFMTLFTGFAFYNAYRG
jgi:hypothetical protein